MEYVPSADAGTAAFIAAQLVEKLLGAEQEAAFPPPIPEQVQSNAPSSPRTSVPVGFPMEQRLFEGFAVTVVPFALPHVPSVPVHTVFPSTREPVSIPEATSRMSHATEPVAVEGVKFQVTTVILFGVIPAVCTREFVLIFPFETDVTSAAPTETTLES